MATSTVIGIDPGLKGGIAVHIPETNYLEVIPLPVKDGEIDCASLAEFLEDNTFLGKRTPVYMEKAQAMPKQGVVSMFNYGKGVGRIQGVVLGLHLPLIEVRPQEWKKAMLPCKVKGKDEAIAFIEYNYPSVDLVLPGRRKPHDGMADAACIAIFGGKYRGD